MSEPLKFQYFDENILALKEASSLDDFTNKLTSIVQTLGFSDVDIEQIKGINKVDFMVSSLPASIYETYKSEKLQEHDVMLDALLLSSEPIFESTAYEYLTNSPFPSLKFDRSTRPHHLMKNYDYHDSYTIPVDLKDFGKTFAFSVLLKGANEKTFHHQVNLQKKNLLEIAKSACHTLCCSGLIPNQLEQNESLSLRQVEVLNTLAKFAKNQREAAEHLKISVRTINSHVDDIKKILGVANLPHAIYIGIERGYIQLDS